MGMIEAIRICFTNYRTVSGRASRPEFWWFLLGFAICAAARAAIVRWRIRPSQKGANNYGPQPAL